MARTVTGVSAEDAAAAVSNRFPVYPAGEYIATIVDVEAKKIQSAANKGKPVLKIKFKITESGTEEGIGKTYTEFNVPDFPTWSSGQTAFLFYQFYRALGVEFSGSGEAELPDLEDLFGEEIGIRLTVEEKTDKAGNKDTDDEGNPLLQNRTGGFFSADKGVKMTVSTADDKFTL
jgi:hypothetical protein